MSSKEHDNTFEKPERETSGDTERRSSEEIVVNDDNYNVDKKIQNPKTEVPPDGDTMEAKEPEMDQVYNFSKMNPLPIFRPNSSTDSMTLNHIIT